LSRKRLENVDHRLEQASSEPLVRCRRFDAREPTREPGKDPDEIARTLTECVAERRLVELGQQGVQRLCDGSVGKGAFTHRDTATSAPGHSGFARDLVQLTEEPGLPDTGLAPDQDGWGAATRGLGKCFAQDALLGDATDEGAARDPGNHHRIIRAPPNLPAIRGR